MLDVQSILKKSAEKSGLSRVRFKERNIPTSIENVVVFPFFGDHRSSFVLSSFLLRRIKEELKSSKYLILASWPGHEGLFPYVDEYWQMEDEAALDKLKNDAIGFDNCSSVMSLMTRNLNQYFYEMLTTKDLEPYYLNGFTKSFFERFKHIRLSLPSIPSPASLGADFARVLLQKESKVFVYPSKNVFSWRFGSIVKSKAPREFWLDMVDILLKNGYTPVVYNDIFSYDISSEFSSECIHLKNIDLVKVFGVMRACGCVIDMFNGISRFALSARVPFICFDERAKFNGLKDYELNDLCPKLPKEYIFGFGTIIEGGEKTSWNSNLFEHMIVKLNKMYGNMDRDSWPSATEINEIVPYDAVRKVKNKKLGSKFIKIERD